MLRSTFWGLVLQIFIGIFLAVVTFLTMSHIFQVISQKHGTKAAINVTLIIIAVFLVLNIVLCILYYEYTSLYDTKIEELRNDKERLLH